MDGKIITSETGRRYKMANLKISKGSQWWYGRYCLNGKEKSIALGVKIEGRRPARLNQTGDALFEKSRAKAEVKMDQFMMDLHTRKSKEKLAKEIYKIQSGGEKLAEYTLSDLFDLWCDMKERSEGRTNTVKPQIGNFVRFMKKTCPSVEFTYQVTSEHAKAFMASEAKRGLAPSTYNGLLKVMKCCFRELDSKAFNKIPTQPAKQIHRVPFTKEELKQIRKESVNNDFVRPVITIAMCTGMRLGDCCNLKWSDIDEAEGVIRVKTSKTDTSVVVPLFDWLKDELDQHQISYDSEYVLPQQRWKYMADASYFIKQLRKILVKIGFGEPASHYRLKKAEVNAQAVKEKVEDYLGSLPKAGRTTRMAEVFALYIEGKTIDHISEKMGISKSTSSLYMNELEHNAKVSFIRGKSRKSDESADKRKPVQVERKGGLKRVSIRDFHAFRTTWVTLALQAGVPVETVRLVTGHKTVEIVIENYFNPSQRDIRDVLKAAMPFSDSKKEVA